MGGEKHREGERETERWRDKNRPKGMSQIEGNTEKKRERKSGGGHEMM